VHSFVHTILKALLTLPVVVTSAERSFSSLQSAAVENMAEEHYTGEERLNGLVLLHQHPEIVIDGDSVINRCAKSGNRKLDFALQSTIRYVTVGVRCINCAQQGLRQAVSLCPVSLSLKKYFYKLMYKL